MAKKPKQNKLVPSNGRPRRDERKPAPDAKLKALLDHYPAERSSLIPLLQLIQEKYGWLAPESLQIVADYLHLSPAVVYGVVTFYAQFYLTRQGRHRVRVCQGTACHVRGGKAIMDRVRKNLGINPGQTSPDYEFSLERVACLGSCALAPVMVVDEKVKGLMTTVKADQVLQQLGKAVAKSKKSARPKAAAA